MLSIGEGGDGEYRKSLLDNTAAKEVFNYVQEQRAFQHMPLIMNMPFYIGDWSRPWGGPLYKSSWWE